MVLCPNCEKPFEEIAGRLHCPEHGYHALNESGEIVPADQPTPAELEQWQKAIDEKEKFTGDGLSAESVPDPEILPDPETPSEGAEIPRFYISEQVIYYTAVAVGAAVIGLALYGLYKKGRRAAKHG